MESLEELARRTAEGDLEAFGAIYRTLLDPLYGYFFWNLSSGAEAEDLTEEVFLRCLVHIGKYDPGKAPFRAWVFRIARNLLVDHLRRSARREAKKAREMEGHEETPPGEDLEEEERRRAVREALRELPPTQRQVVIMKYFTGMNNAEVASALGKSEGAVNAIQHRALRKLGDVLVRRGWGE
ncbi:sigma-70 family RNA polymerase sigma factor [Candidatus Solincola tengchongensis]|uniref:RNA polymerase sigma factor n=1 Tax=Candidatus Solincola tengchongensis TaxID=2900693 RepID=UPI00257995BD|nr:sigma-70 family RNA polymerase sigma factor [Candidatus Solincola tengchongensis]